MKTIEIPRGRLTIGALLLVAMSVGACGGGDADEAAEPSSETGATSTTVGTTGADTTTTSPPAASTTTGSGQDEFSPSQCPELVAMLNAASVAAAGAPGFAGGEFTVEFYDELAARAPSEIRGDIETIAAAAESFFTVLSDAGVDFEDPSSFAALDEATLAELEAAAEVWESPEVEAANDRIQAFFERECS